MTIFDVSDVAGVQLSGQPGTCAVPGRVERSERRPRRRYQSQRRVRKLPKSMAVTSMRAHAYERAHASIYIACNYRLRSLRAESGSGGRPFPACSFAAREIAIPVSRVRARHLLAPTTTSPCDYHPSCTRSPSVQQQQQQ